MKPNIITTSIDELARKVLQALQNGSPISTATNGIVIQQSSYSGRHPRDILDATKVIVVMGDQCCYVPPPGDYVVLPPKSWFPFGAYWPTVLHELIHRCEWILGFNGSEAAGELRAEVGVAVLELLLGQPHCPDQTNYRLWRPTWLGEWKADPVSMTKAVASGVEAAEFLLSYLDAEEDPNDPLVECGMNALVEQILGEQSLESSTPSVVTSLEPEGKHEQPEESSSANHRPDHPSP